MMDSTAPVPPGPRDFSLFGSWVPLWEGFPHVLQTQQFSREHLECLFALTGHVLDARTCGRVTPFPFLGHGRRLLTLFFEGSSRTICSFLRAAQELGMRTIDVRDPQHTSSEVKGESFEDSIRTYSGGTDHPFRIADVIVVRHPEVEPVLRAAAVSPVPVINAGNGPDQHPTQSLVDLFALRQELGRLDQLHLVLVGDLKNGRTARSLAYLLGKNFQGIRFTFLSHPALRMREDVRAFLDRHGVAYAEEHAYGSGAQSVLRDADAVYLLRTQTERDPEKLRALAPELRALRFTQEHPRELRPGARVFHPLPINRADPELSEVDEELSAAARSVAAGERDERLAWFRQADCGIPVRTALLAVILRHFWNFS